MAAISTRILGGWRALASLTLMVVVLSLPGSARAGCWLSHAGHGQGGLGVLGVAELEGLLETVPTALPGQQAPSPCRGMRCAGDPVPPVPAPVVVTDQREQPGSTDWALSLASAALADRRFEADDSPLPVHRANPPFRPPWA